MGNFATQTGEDEEEIKFQDFSFRVSIGDAKKIKKFLKEKKIKLLSKI